MKIKLISFILMIFMLTPQLVSCKSNNKLYAFFYLQAKEWINEEYLREYRITNVAYPGDIKYKEGEKSHTVLIKDAKTYNKMFYEPAPDIDFNKYMAVLHVRSSWGVADSNLSIDRVKLDSEGVVKITVKCVSERYNSDPTFGAASYPAPAYFLIVVKQQNATSAEVVFEAPWISK